MAVDVRRERAIAAALADRPIAELQPGLFEQRAVRDAAAVERRQASIHDELERSLARLDQASSISTGTPDLVVWLKSG